MTQAQQAAFVHRCYETAYEKQSRAGKTFLPSVPPEMRTGLTDSRGWFQWKLIPAPTRAEDLDALEGKWGLTLPSLLRAFLSTDCHFLDVPGFFAVRPDDPLSVFRTTMEEPTLFQAGLIPLGWGENAAGGDALYCLDSMPDRRPVVSLDYLSFSMELAGGGDRESLLEISQPAAEDFTTYAEQLFLR